MYIKISVLLLIVFCNTGKTQVTVNITVTPSPNATVVMIPFIPMIYYYPVYPVYPVYPYPVGYFFG